MEEKKCSQEALEAIEAREAAFIDVQNENVALQEENEKLKKQIEQLINEKDSYSKYWSESEANISRIKEQLNAVLVLIGNIK